MSNTKHCGKCSQRIATHIDSTSQLVWDNSASPFPDTQTVGGRGKQAPIRICLHPIPGVHLRDPSHPAIIVGRTKSWGLAWKRASFYLHPLWHLPPWQMPSINARSCLLSYWKASAQQSGSSKQKHPIDNQGKSLPFSLGFADWQQLQVWSRKVAQAFLCQHQQLKKRERSGRQSVTHTDLASYMNHTTSGTTLPCLKPGWSCDRCHAHAGFGQAARIWWQVPSITNLAMAR